jgi:hypothetical protein
MKTLNTVGMNRVVVGLAAMIAVTCFGEAGYNPTQISQDIGKAESLLNPASKALGSATQSKDGQDLSAGLKEAVEKAEKAVTTNQNELKWRKDNEAKREKLDKLKTANSIPAILKLNIQQRREEANTQLKNLFGQLNTQPQSTVNAADFDMSSLHPQCSEGVDFGQFRSMADQMNSQPFRYLREQGTLLIQEKDKKAKEDRLKNLAAAAKEFDKLADKDDEEKGQVSVLDQNLSPEARIEGLKEDGARIDKGIKAQRKALVKAMFTDLIPALSQIEENDERLVQIAANFADNLEGFRKASYETAIANAQRLKGNCERMAKELGRDGPFAPGTLLSQAYQKVVEFHQGDANFYANTTFAAGMQQMVNDARCPSAVSQIDSAFGGNLQSTIAALRSAKDPNTLIQGAMSTMQAVANAQAQVGPAVKSLGSRCDKVGRNKEKVEKFIQSIQASIQQEQQAAQAEGTPRLQGNRTRGGTSGAGGAATHRAGTVGR